MPPKKKHQSELVGVSKIGNDYPSYFKKVANYNDKKILYSKVVDEENWYRELFAQDRTNKLLDDPHLMLVNAHENTDIFKYQKESSEEAALPRVFQIPKEMKRNPGDPCIVGEREFKRNFDVFTESQFRFLNWKNVFAAGGAVLAALTPIPEAHDQNNQTRREYYHKIAYRNSDIDLFVYGLETEEEANKKLQEIYFAVCETLPHAAICFRSKHAVTIVSQYPYRHIQIILRLYKSPAEVLMGFDVDSCSVGFDGEKVWMTPRAHRALSHQYNSVDMTRRSPTYEQRLAKYSSRGFSVLVPGLDRSRVDPQLFERRFDQLQGLARLILLEKLATPEARTAYKAQQRLKKLRPEMKQQQSWLDKMEGKLGREMRQDEYIRERVEDIGSDASDYSTVFLPWSPKWTADKARKLMYTKDLVLNSKWYDPNKKYHTHPCFFGTAEEVLRDCCGKCPPIPPEDDDPDSPFVSGKLIWVTVNPGAQKAPRIGSFHPITEGDWQEGSYVSDDTTNLILAANSNDAKTLEALIVNYKSKLLPGQELASIVDSRDCTGRTSLMVAAFSNSIDCVKVLLKYNARINTRLGDGRTALMIAAAYGHTEIVKAIIKYGVELENKKRVRAEEEAAKKAKEKKKAKKNKNKNKKKKEEDEEDDEEMDVEDEEDEEEDEEDEDGEDEEEEEEAEEADEEFTSIKSLIAEKKKKELEDEEALDPSLKVEDEDSFDLTQTDWDLKFNPLHYALFFGHVDAATALVEAGANPQEGVTFPESGAMYTTLHLALFGGSVPALQMLLTKGVPLSVRDHERSTILHRAAIAKNAEFIKAILEWKRNTKDQTLNVDDLNNQNKTALNLLISNSTKPEEIDDEVDPMDIDTSKKSKKKKDVTDPLDPDAFELIKLLIDNGAKVQYTESDLPSTTQQQMFGHGNRFGSNNATSTRAQVRSVFSQPILQAASMASIDLLAFLFDRGADINSFSPNFNWDTPLDIALRNIESLQNAERNEEEYDSMAQVKKLCDKQSKNSLLKLELERQLQGATGNRKYYGNRNVANSKQKELEEQKSKIKLKLTRERTKARWEAVRDWLRKKKALALTDLSLKLDTDDSDASNAVHSRRTHPYGWSNYRTNSDTQPVTVSFSAITEQIPGVYRSRSVLYTQEEQKSYEELYTAILDGDIKKINKLTIEQPIGKQLHVCSHLTASGRSTLQLAVERNLPKVAVRLLEIALEQFTPLKYTENKKDNKTPLINNYDLSRVMNQLRPGAYLDFSQMTIEEDSRRVDPNAPVVQLNCITSAVGLLSSTDNSNMNFVQTAAVSNSSEALAAVMEFITKNKDKIIQNTDYQDQGPSHPRQRKEDLIQVLLNFHQYGAFPAFQLAISKGHVNTAKELIRFGALGAPVVAAVQVQQKDEEAYEGLDVGGKKMDWVKFHKQGKKDKPTRTTLHIAAALDKPESVAFLVSKEALEIYKKSGATDTKIPRDLDLRAVNEMGHTAYHYAITQNSLSSLKKLIEVDQNQPKLMDVGDNEGVTPLSLCANLGWTEGLTALLLAGADPSIADKTRGWTPLHHATARPECVETLLKHVDSSLANSKSKGFDQTPLMVASYFGHTKSVQIMLDSGKLDKKAQDASGDLALHHAVKQLHDDIVELLLIEKGSKADVYAGENGVGYTLLDCIMKKLEGTIHTSRSNNTVVNSHSTRQKKIYDRVLSHLSKKRIIVSNETVRKVTDIVIAQTNLAVEKNRQAALGKLHNRDYDDYYSDDDDDDEGVVHALGETHDSVVKTAYVQQV